MSVLKSLDPYNIGASLPGKTPIKPFFTMPALHYIDNSKQVYNALVKT